VSVLASALKISSGARPPEQPVILVPGHHFFTSIAPLAGNTPAGDVAGLASLALEADSPFAAEQLATGHYAMAADGGLVVFAALRRKFATTQEAWGQASFVIPDFATWLPGAEASNSTVILETPESVTAIEYGSGSKVPRRIISRPVSKDVGYEEAVAVAREHAIARLTGSGRRLRRYRMASTPCTVRRGRYQFHWEAIDSGPEPVPATTELTAAQLWALDLREPEVLRLRRRAYQYDRYAWGTFVGMGIAAAALLVSELPLLGCVGVNAARRIRIQNQTPAVQQSEKNKDIVERLTNYLDRKPMPLDLLGYINDQRPGSIYFTKVSTEGASQMTVEGATSVLADVNEYEAALKRTDAIANVEVKNIRVREGGGTFQLLIKFKPGALSSNTMAAASPAPAPAAP
jgi:hypothetical protein